MKPLMANYEIAEIEDILLDLERHAPLDILEWGSGGSTVYFPEFLSLTGIPFTWLSLEYNRRWYTHVTETVAGMEADLLGPVSVQLFPVDNDRSKQMHTNMDEYVAYPASLGRKWDFILVDGRKRRRCLLEAVNLLKPHGVVLLHDAEREYYHCAFSAYQNGHFTARRLWKGYAN